MELKLDDNTEFQTTEDATPSLTGSRGFSVQNEPAADEDGYYHIPEKPIPAVLPPEKKTFHIPRLVIILLVLALAALILSILPINKKKSLDEIVRMSRNEMEQELGITLTADPSAVKKLSIPNGESEGFEVYTNAKKDFGVIYYNGKQHGVCFDSTRYSLFGVTIGDSESHLFQEAANADSTGLQLNTSNEKPYSYSYYFNMMEDMSKGGSTADYVMGTDGSVLVLVVNDTSHRVVNVIYYYNSSRVMKDVDMF